MDLTSARKLLTALASGLLLLVAAASPGWAGAAAGGATDAIYRKGVAEPIRNVITAESMDGIEMGKVAIQTIGVARVDYFDAPEAYKRGHDRLQQGLYAEGIKYFEAALRTPNVRKFWLEPACAYYTAVCLQEDGADLAAAVAKFKEVLDKFPNSRYQPDALLGAGRAEHLARRYDAAIGWFKKLAELAAQKTGWDEWLATAYVGQGRTYLAAGKLELAAQAVAKVIAAGAGDPKLGDLVNQAKMIQAMIVLQQNEPEKAIKQLQDLIREIAPRVAEEIERGGNEVRWQRTEAQCYNTLGHAYLKLHGKSKKEEDLRQALLSFMWTVVLYARSQFAVEHAEALFHAAQCFEKLKQKARAVELLNELADKYPDSPLNRTPGAGKAGAPRKETEK